MPWIPIALFLYATSVGHALICTDKPDALAVCTAIDETVIP